MTAQEIAYRIRLESAVENVLFEHYPVWSTARHFRVKKVDLQAEVDWRRGKGPGAFIDGDETTSKRRRSAQLSFFD